MGSSGQREKAEDCPQKGLELNGAGDGARNESEPQHRPDITWLPRRGPHWPRTTTRHFLETKQSCYHMQFLVGQYENGNRLMADQSGVTGALRFWGSPWV